MEQKYIELLEKANQQLSYTWNPIVIQITILAILVGVLTIFATGLIIWININYKKVINNFFKEQERLRAEALKKFDQDIQKRRQRINSLEIKVSKLLRKKSTKEELEVIKKELDELKQEKANIATFSTTTPLGMPTFLSLTNSPDVLIASGRCIGCNTVLPAGHLSSLCDECSYLLQKNKKGTLKGMVLK